MPTGTARLLRDECGGIAVEYGLLVAFIAASLIVLIVEVGAGVLDLLQGIIAFFETASG